MSEDTTATSATAPVENFESNPTRYYYVDKDAKIVEWSSKEIETPQGFTAAGMSQLSVRAAAGFYTNNESGYTIREHEIKQEASGQEEE